MIQLKKSHQSFGGETRFYSHDSAVTKTEMNFSVFMPAAKPKAAIIWLSGLTCTEENFMAKAGVQALLAKDDTMIICPDTSPRGLDLPDEHESYDFGSGAGFYVNATTEGYKDHYQMYDYVNEEIHALLTNDFAIPTNKISIMGHSMGGHGALVVGLRNPQKYQSVSAFAPIANPMQCAWGRKAFTGYLGTDEPEWKAYDACEIIKNGQTHPNPILVDQGLGDEFLADQLLTQNLADQCVASGQVLELNMREDYDHSYYFITSFLENHISFHQQYLA